MDGVYVHPITELPFANGLWTLMCHDLGEHGKPGNANLPRTCKIQQHECEGVSIKGPILTMLEWRSMISKECFRVERVLGTPILRDLTNRQNLP